MLCCRIMIFLEEYFLILRHIILFALIIIAKGVFTAVETALNIKERKKDKTEESENHHFDEDIFGNKTNRIRLQIATVNVINVILVMAVGFLLTSDFVGAILKGLFKGKYLISYQISFIIVTIVIVIILTYLLVLIGAVIPRRIANRNYKKVLSSTRAIVEILHFVCYPLIMLIHVSVNIFNIFFDTSTSENVTQEEIIQLINEGEEKGAIDENEKEMINNIFEFDDKTAGEIATHRMDIVAMPLESTIDDVIKVIMEEKYSRIPVYEDNIDNIVGILYLKDVFKHIVHFGKEEFNLKELLMEPFFVPFSKKTDELFEQMQKNKIHMSIVIDEYGGTAGIVTMEDLIEEVMGNILDEYDEEETPEIRRIDDNTFLLDGTAELDEVEKELEVNFNNEEFDTIGGFVVSLIGKIPEDDEEYNVQFEDFNFKVEKIEEKRISLIKAERIKADNKSEPEEAETKEE